jgi:hypothetical protein
MSELKELMEEFDFEQWLDTEDLVSSWLKDFKGA